MKKKLNCKDVPQSLYAIINGELIEYKFHSEELMYDKLWYLIYDNTVDYEKYYLGHLDDDEIYVKDKMYYDDKQECIKDYLEILNEKRKGLSQELDTIKIYINKLNCEYNHYDILLNSLS